MEKIAHVRIDDRLIHGQIVHAWITSVGAGTIVVADDAAAKDELRKSLLRMATPKGVRLKVLTVAKAAKYLLDPETDVTKVLLILRDVEGAIALVDAGVVPDEINVGNVSAAPGKTQYFKSVFLDEEDIRRFEQLRERGIALEVQVVPTERKEELFHLIGRK